MIIINRVDLFDSKLKITSSNGGTDEESWGWLIRSEVHTVRPGCTDCSNPSLTEGAAIIIVWAHGAIYLRREAGRCGIVSQRLTLDARGGIRSWPRNFWTLTFVSQELISAGFIFLFFWIDHSVRPLVRNCTCDTSRHTGSNAKTCLGHPAVLIPDDECDLETRKPDSIYPNVVVTPAQRALTLESVWLSSTFFRIRSVVFKKKKFLCSQCFESSDGSNECSKTGSCLLWNEVGLHETTASPGGSRVKDDRLSSLLVSSFFREMKKRWRRRRRSRRRKRRRSRRIAANVGIRGTSWRDYRSR